MAKKKPVTKPQKAKPTTNRKVVAVKAVASKPKVASDKKTALQKQIEALQTQMQSLQQEAVHELKLKLSDARKVVAGLEHELAVITGKAPRKQRR